MHNIPHLSALKQPANLLTNRTYYSWDDIGAARMFADLCKPILRPIREYDGWMYYDGTHWTELRKAAEFAKYFHDYLKSRAYDVEEVARTDFQKFAAKYATAKARTTLIADASDIHPISIFDFDVNQYLTNCQNGTFDLRTGVLRPHNPEDYLSRIAGFEYDRDAMHPRLARFIDEIMCADRASADYLQRCMGYALSGATPYECFFILLGSKNRNGKGVLMNVMQAMLGDYARAAQPASIAAKRFASGSGPSEDIARLAGRRLVSMSEPEKGMTLDASLLKQLTGGDPITARELNRPSFEFRPQFKLYLSANSLPAVTDMSLFKGTRVHVIPFEHHFPDAEQEMNLKDKLCAAPRALSALFNWCYAGFVQLYDTSRYSPTNPLTAHDAWRNKTALAPMSGAKAALCEYEEDFDTLGAFVDDIYEVSPTSQVPIDSIYKDYWNWCELNGITFKMTKNMLSRELKGKGFKPGRSASCRYINGLRKTAPNGFVRTFESDDVFPADDMTRL